MDNPKPEDFFLNNPKPEDFFRNRCSSENFKKKAVCVRPIGGGALIGINPYTGTNLVWSKEEVFNLDLDSVTGAYLWLATTMRKLTTCNQNLRLLVLCKFAPDSWCFATVCTMGKPGFYSVLLMDQQNGQMNGTLECLAYFSPETKVVRKVKKDLFEKDTPLNFTFYGRPKAGRTVHTSFSVSSQALNGASPLARKAVEFLCQTIMTHPFWWRREWANSPNIYSFQYDPEDDGDRRHVSVFPHEPTRDYETLIPFKPTLGSSGEPPLAPPTEEEAQASSSSSSPEPATEEEAQAASSSSLPSSPHVQQQSEDAKGKCKMPVQQQSQEVKGVRQCEACGKQEKYLFRCAGCERVRYCTRTCQKKHWHSHKSACKKN